jgi:hypothetical protein
MTVSSNGPVPDLDQHRSGHVVRTDDHSRFHAVGHKHALAPLEHRQRCSSVFSVIIVLRFFLSLSIAEADNVVSGPCRL